MSSPRPTGTPGGGPARGAGPVTVGNCATRPVNRGACPRAGRFNLGGPAGPAGGSPVRREPPFLKVEILGFSNFRNCPGSPLHVTAAPSHAGWAAGLSASCWGPASESAAAMAGPMVGLTYRAVLGSSAECLQGIFRHAPWPGESGPARTTSDSNDRKPEGYPVRILRVVLPALHIRSDHPEMRAQQQAREAP